MKSPRLHWISENDPPDAFPPIDSAFETPDGLLAAGGDLSERRLLHAYAHGIFPWYSEEQPILWWSPDPRCVLMPADLRIAPRSRRSLRNSGFTVNFNRDFDAVIARCAAARPGQDGSWITEEMNGAYRTLHLAGWAHSIEICLDGHLAGGLYGLAIGKAFFGESMFSRVSNASKAAMLALCDVLQNHEFGLLDCQVASPHILSMGAITIDRRIFADELRRACQLPAKFADWPPDGRSIVEFGV
jgi:leucyl/phenylalanyl-tRNA--protein transferase